MTINTSVLEPLLRVLTYPLQSAMGLLFLASGMMMATGYAENLVLDNQTSYPASSQKSKMAIQWAASAQEVQEENHAVMYGSSLKQEKIQTLTAPGKVTLTIPPKGEYFRVIVWSKGEGDPDLLTNWVDVIPNKVYKLEPDHLVPVVLMMGTGCQTAYTEEDNLIETKLLPQTKNGRLKMFVEQFRNMVADHLQKAREIQKTL